MARSALVESLLGQADRDAQAVADAAHAAADRLRAERASALEQERLRLEREVALEVQRIEGQGANDAAHEVRALNAGAAVALAGRLLQLARDELPQLCGARREVLFAALATELPPCSWESVRVNPADAGLAAGRFPGASVAADPAISGGLEVAREAGRVAVSNTLETRLAAAWPDLLPGLIAEVAAQAAAHGTAA